MLVMGLIAAAVHSLRATTQHYTAKHRSDQVKEDLHMAFVVLGWPWSTTKLWIEEGRID